MSGVVKRERRQQEIKVVERYNTGGVIVDPTIDIAQPGGPFPVGHAILADGMGGYTIDAPYRPYLLSFYLAAQQMAPGWELPFKFNGVDTTKLGPSLPFDCHIVGYSATVNIDPSGGPNQLALTITSRGLKGEISADAVPILIEEHPVVYDRSLAVEYFRGSQLSLVLRNVGDEDISFTDILLTLELQI